MVRKTLSVPDLVVLSLLSERPMHGYEALKTLDEREVQDWAEISNAQVYYSLRKLADLGLIEAAEDPGQLLGPERQPYGPTRRGRRALGDALDRADWSTKRPPPPFLTWLALASHARPATVRRQIERRRRFVEAELQRERNSRRTSRADAEPMRAAAALMVELTIRQFEVERIWLDEVENRLVGAARETS